MIDWNTEESLYLRRVKIHGQQSIRTRRHQQVRDDFRGDRHPRFILAILPRIPEVWQDRRDTFCRGALEGVDHQKQFEKIGVHGRACRLHDKNVGAPYIFENLKVDFAVAETRNRGLSQLAVQELANFICERRIRSSTEDLQFITHKCVL